MSLYTLVFILVTVLVLVGIALFGLLISKLDKWIDRRDRLGKDSVKRETDNVRREKM